MLFDLDGTLIDPIVGITGAYQCAAEAISRNVPSADEVRTLIGPPIQEVFADRWACSADELVRAVEGFRQYYGATGITEFTVYEGVDQMLARLSESGVRLAVATSKPVPYAEQIIESLGWTSVFDFVGGAELSGERRAKAEVISHVLERLDGAAAEATMIGDRQEDVLGALAVGVTPIGVLWGYGSREELEGAGAELLLASPRDCELMLR